MPYSYIKEKNTSPQFSLRSTAEHLKPSIRWYGRNFLPITVAEGTLTAAYANFFIEGEPKTVMPISLAIAVLAVFGEIFKVNSNH